MDLNSDRDKGGVDSSFYEELRASNVIQPCRATLSSKRDDRDSRTRLEYDLLEEHELEERQQQRDPVPECTLPPAYGGRKFRTFIQCVTWLGLLSCLGFTGVAIGVMAKILADGSKLGLDITSADFALYKNSGFQECRAREPPADPATCPDVLANLLSPGWDDRRNTAAEFSHVTDDYLVSKNRTQTPGGDPVVYDWCEAVSCLDSTFTVVPSIPSGPASDATCLTVWCSITVTLFTAVWGYESLERRRGKEKACRALGDVAWYDWALHGYNLCSFAWWWVSFSSYVVGRTYTLPPGAIGWVVPWKCSMIVEYHLYSCAVANKRWPRTLSWIFGFLAFVQWTATVYLSLVGLPKAARDDRTFQSYDCADAFMTEAPDGPCSAQQLCAKPGLFIDRFFWYDGEVLNPETAATLFFVLFTVASVVPSGIAMFLLVSNGIRRGRLLSMDQIKHGREKFGMTPTNVLAFAAWVSIATLGTLLTLSLISRANRHGREAPLSFYPPCRAVHVAMSPWSFNLDVDQDHRVMRLVKLWFNA